MHPVPFLFLTPALAAAALYPTSPVTATVFHPSITHPNIIRWTDDLSPPSLNQLGNMRIDLLLENTIIATLARSIPCTYREVKLFVPPGLGPDSSDYALIFVPSVPYKPVYSSRFTISNYTSGSHPSRIQNSTVSSYSTFSPIISTETFGGHSSISNPSSIFNPAKATSTFKSGREKIGTVASGGHRVRIECSTRFKALYVLWPVLVGAALAS